MQENKDGTFEEIKPFSEFMEKVAKMGPYDFGDVRAFHFGTKSELKEIKRKKSLEQQVKELKGDVEKLKSEKNTSEYFVFPTPEEIKKYASKGPMEKNMLKIMAGIAQKWTNTQKQSR